MEVSQSTFHFTPRKAFTISGDYEYLKRAFSNLILNALQAMPNGGDLLIETLPLTLDADEESVIDVERATKIIFKDSGVGMDTETTKNIFNLFYSTKDKGTGLGLGNSSKNNRRA